MVRWSGVGWWWRDGMEMGCWVLDKMIEWWVVWRDVGWSGAERSGVIGVVGGG